MRALQYYFWPLLCGVLFSTTLYFYTHSQTAIAPNSKLSFAHAVAQAAPSVVNVYTQKTVLINRHSNFPDWFERFRPRKRIENSLGSGVVVSAQGHIVTALHVIEGADQIWVLLPDGREASAMVTGKDLAADIAVLKINLGNLPVIDIGNVEEIYIGDIVLAIGNPYGIGQSVSQGVISGINRTVLGLDTDEHFIQTDAAINLGSSGGALINTKGELLGINTRAVDSFGIGFATPVDVAMEAVDSIIKYGHIARGWLGFTARFINSDNLRSITPQYQAGLYIDYLHNDGPAAKAGLLVGDVILQVNNKDIISIHGIRKVLANIRATEKVALTTWRNGQEEIITLTAIAHNQ